jgi:hypothetical protein
MNCEKTVGGVPCGKDAIVSTLDPNGEYRWFCDDHLWVKSSADQHEGTCDMATMGGKCGRPSVEKWVNQFGTDVHYWCAECRREHFPTDKEKIQKAKAEQKTDRIGEIFYSLVMKPIGYLMLLAFIGVGIYGVVAFIHWCWKNS